MAQAERAKVSSRRHPTEVTCDCGKQKVLRTHSEEGRRGKRLWGQGTWWLQAGVVCWVSRGMIEVSYEKHDEC